jgi:hypothetical protein
MYIKNWKIVPGIWNFEHSCELHLLQPLDMIQEIQYSFYPPSAVTERVYFILSH